MVDAFDCLTRLRVGHRHGRPAPNKPCLHWAMDNHLIAPGPDHRWHLSPTVGALVPDNRWLCDLDGQPLVLPRDPRWLPASDALAWRLDHLWR